jgi:hypothetical protein
MLGLHRAAALDAGAPNIPAARLPYGASPSAGYMAGKAVRRMASETGLTRLGDTPKRPNARECGSEQSSVKYGASFRR